ncbi:MAG: hypothetical protein QM727_00255 [Niabella sp.]
MNRISFHDTHVYPGCLAIIFFKINPDGTVMPAQAEFSDGAVAGAEIGQVVSNEVHVRIDAYQTARGTRIPEKAWRLRYDEEQDIWKVTGKM